jgi:hypothetical protein
MYRNYVDGVFAQSTMYSPHLLTSTVVSTIQPISSIQGGTNHSVSTISTCITFQCLPFITYETMNDIKLGGVYCRST